MWEGNLLSTGKEKLTRHVALIIFREFLPIFGFSIGEGPYIHFLKSWLQSPLGKFFNKQEFEQSKYISNKMLYEDDSALYETLWWNRFFLNNFGFNCFSIFAYVHIFLYGYISKDIKCLNLSNKKLHEDDYPFYEISGQLHSYRILLVLIA